MDVLKDLDVYIPGDMKTNDAFRMYIHRGVKKMFGTTNHQEIYKFLRTGQLD